MNKCHDGARQEHQLYIVTLKVVLQNSTHDRTCPLHSLLPQSLSVIKLEAKKRTNIKGHNLVNYHKVSSIKVHRVKFEVSGSQGIRGDFIENLLVGPLHLDPFTLTCAIRLPLQISAHANNV